MSRRPKTSRSVVLVPRSQFNAWQGLLRDPADWDPVVRAAWVSAGYTLPAVFAAVTVFVRRDVGGG